MLLHQASEEGDPQSIKVFLEAQYPDIVASVSGNVLAILVGHLAANGRASMTEFERTIMARVAEDIADAQNTGITRHEDIVVFLADLYTQIYGSQDVMRAVAWAGMWAMTPWYHEVVRRFYQMQASRYAIEGLRGVKPSCPFQGLIRKTATRLIQAFFGK